MAKNQRDIKHWMGSAHFLTKTLARVSTEMSLHVLAYNLKRVMRDCKAEESTHRLQVVATHIGPGHHHAGTGTVRELAGVAGTDDTAWNGRPDAADAFLGCPSRVGNYGTQLSSGEQQMLAIARALLGNPRVLLMDEPFEGLAPLVVEQLVAAIQKIATHGSLAFLLVEQRVDIALDLSRRCLVMDRGRCVFDGSSCDVAEDGSSLPLLMGLVN